MKATQILMDEHRVIERVIVALEIAAGKLGKGENISPQFFLNASDFISGFADGCHHQKEEGVLFKTMSVHGTPENSGPIAVMLHEHEQGRQFNRQMSAAAKRLAAGGQGAVNDIVQNALGYANLLRQHIQKEDQILFPMADKVIPTPQHDQVFEDFEHIEHHETGEGVHEKYLALAEALEREVSDG